jgi:hypothetical protein
MSHTVEKDALDRLIERAGQEHPYGDSPWWRLIAEVREETRPIPPGVGNPS